ncbi:MAG: Gfo/Idh/MocA family oxidoreductase [Erysipelotrichaceae bacterium]|nr:Gfo/Idh/MocA family oxidoreductase [Erysipelotrichaceae bacterium]
MIDNKLVVGYIGNGKSANRYHLPFITQRKDKFIVKSIFDIHVRHDIWSKIDGVQYTENVDDILNDPDIDMVVICTTHHLHYEYAKKVLNAHKHCLVEKPFMETSEQAKEIFALADSLNLYCSSYQNRRYDSDFLTVQKVIESGVLGDLLEVEMHYDYYRPEVPEGVHYFDPAFSFLYGHGCHTLDQVISYFGKPDNIHYDVKQILGTGRMNDYFDLDLYYGSLKVSVKSSYFRIKERPSFIVYGKKGMFVKQTKDRQEEHLKLFYMPDNDDFGIDKPEHYGVLTYYDDNHVYHEEKVPSVNGDYGRVYDGIYECIVNHKDQIITHDQTLLQMEILENGVKDLK